MVVLWDSARYRMNDCWWQTNCSPTPAHHSSISAETIRDFERTTRLTSPLRADFGFELPVELLSEKYRVALEANGKGASDSLRKINRYADSSPFWLAFRKRYPQAWGFTALSRVGFDKGRRQALVEVMHRCSSSCEHTEDIFLEKSESGWHVKERMMIGRGSDWVDVTQRFGSPIGDGRDSLVLRSLRYLGPDGHFLSLVRNGMDSVRTLIRDSIARDSLPRRITGTIRSRITRMPIPFAEVIAHVLPNDKKVRTVSDSAGRYSFFNLPIGGTMLEVQCPGASGATGKTLDAPGLYLHQALDTVIDSTVPDIAPCWKQKTIHPFSTGWFESKEALSAMTLDADEREVYRASIRVLRRRDPRINLAAIFSHTIPRCDDAEHCGSIQFPRLAREGLVDSVMIRDFTARTARKGVLDPVFLRSLGLHVVTPPEIQYYADDAVPIGQRPNDAKIDSALFYSAFRQLTGKGSGVLAVSSIGFDESRSRAALEARIDTAVGSWGPPTMLLLRKVGDGWRLTNDDAGKEATSGEWVGNVCLPVKAPRDLKRDALEKLSGTFLVRFVETAGLRNGGSTLLRFAHEFPKPFDFAPRASTPNRAHKKQPLVFEIIDEDTRKADDERSLDFIVIGAGDYVARKSNRYQLDGYTTSLKILKVAPVGFFGSWSAGVFGPSEFGYFCARRAN
jgi:hypothetical protein